MRHIRKSRYLRNWGRTTAPSGFDARLTPDEGARLVAAVAAETERLATAARRAGLEEPRRAMAADALVALARRTTTDDDTGHGRGLVRVEWAMPRRCAHHHPPRAGGPRRAGPRPCGGWRAL